MQASEWVFSNKLEKYPAMNEYSPSYETVKIGITVYIMIWILVIAILYRILRFNLRKIPIIVGFISGALFIYIQYILKYTEHTFIILPDKKLYSTLSTGNDDYKVILKENPYGFVNERKHGYIVSGDSYNKYKKENPGNFTTLTDYLGVLSNPLPGKKLRQNEIPDIEDGFNDEMRGLSMTAYYISIVMITWVGYVYLTGNIDAETNIFSLLSVLTAIISTIPVLVPTNVITMTKHIFVRQTAVHLATAFALAALTERIIQK